MSTKKTAKPVSKAAKKPAPKAAAKKAAPKAAAKKAAPKSAAKKAVAKAPAKKPAAKAAAKKAEVAKRPAVKPTVKSESPKLETVVVPPVSAALESKLEIAEKKSSAKVPPKITLRTQSKNPPPLSQESIDQFEAEREEQCKVALQIAMRMKERHLKEAQRQEEKPSIKLPRRPTTRAAGKNTVKFPDADLKRFRRSLLDMRDALLGRSGALKTAALERNDERTAEDDDGTDAFMRLQALGQVGDQNRTIAQIDEALRKIDDGSYGVCEMCGQLIRKQRLEHLPFARTCMECQSEVEKPFGSR